MWPGKKLCCRRISAQSTLLKKKEEKKGRRMVLKAARAGGDAYPRTVRQMLMRRSAPQPAMRKTPRGGTAGIGVDSVLGIVRLGVGRVEKESAYGRW